MLSKECASKNVQRYYANPVISVLYLVYRKTVYLMLQYELN